VPNFEDDELEVVEMPERWRERMEGTPDWRREGMGEGEAGAGREEESDVCLDAVPEPEGVRISAAAVLKTWEGDAGRGGSVMCICVGVFRPQASPDSAAGGAETVDVGRLPGAQASVPPTEPFSVLWGELAVGVRAREAVVGVRGVAAVALALCVSTVGTTPLGSFDASLL
jgi:hypothetical protein